jgi:hypothetical protein
VDTRKSIARERERERKERKIAMLSKDGERIISC